MPVLALRARILAAPVLLGRHILTAAVPAAVTLVAVPTILVVAQVPVVPARVDPRQVARAARRAVQGVARTDAMSASAKTKFQRIGQFSFCNAPNL